MPQVAARGSEEAGEDVFFEIVKNTGELVCITVNDPGGVGIEFHFTNWQSDPPVDDALFHFHPPSGVTIVNGELPAGNGGMKPLAFRALQASFLTKNSQPPGPSPHINYLR